jgi:hypothetical protein
MCGVTKMDWDKAKRVAPDEPSPILPWTGRSLRFQQSSLKRQSTARRGATPWRGRHIQVDEAATGKLVWSWWCCCQCHKELYRGRDIAEGLHGRCRRRLSDADVERLQDSAREEDRRLWRLDHPST